MSTRSAPASPAVLARRLPARVDSVSLVSRTKLSGLGRHYGARIGRTVLEHQRGEGVRALPLDGFARGHRVTVELEVHGEEARAALARARIAPGRFRRYRFLDGNCEHFARYIVEGLRKSNQISWMLAACVFATFILAGRR